MSTSANFKEAAPRGRTAHGGVAVGSLLGNIRDMQGVWEVHAGSTHAHRHERQVHVLTHLSYALFAMLKQAFAH